jgi:hypothetical protein
MADPDAHAGQKPAPAPSSRRRRGLTERRIPPLESKISIGANVIATFVSLVILVIVSWAGLEVLFLFVDVTEIGRLPIAATPVEAVLAAAGGALAFLIVGIILQLWQRHHQFASWWPMILAFPVCWVLLLPEPLVHGGSIRCWMIVATGLAATFCIHWLVVLAAWEALD